MGIKTLLYVIGYIIMGLVINAILSDKNEKDPFYISFIVLLAWPLCLFFMIPVVIVNVIYELCGFVAFIVMLCKKDEELHNKCKTCLYNKSASSRPVCLECTNGSLYEREEE